MKIEMETKFYPSEHKAVVMLDADGEFRAKSVRIEEVMVASSISSSAYKVTYKVRIISALEGITCEAPFEVDESKLFYLGDAQTLADDLMKKVVVRSEDK